MMTSSALHRARGVTDKAFLDLGASVNILPYSVYLQMGLGELKPTKMRIQLADRSVIIPRGIIEDVLVKIEHFYYPVDLVVIDTEPTQDMSHQTRMILGRPFLAASNALINCRNSLMKISFGHMTLELNIFHVNNRREEQEDDDDDGFEVDEIEQYVDESFRSCYVDPLKSVLRSETKDNDISENFSSPTHECTNDPKATPSENDLLNKKGKSEISISTPTDPLPSVANVDVLSDVHREKEKPKSSKKKHPLHKHKRKHMLSADMIMKMREDPLILSDDEGDEDFKST